MLKFSLYKATLCAIVGTIVAAICFLNFLHAQTSPTPTPPTCGSLQSAYFPISTTITDDAVRLRALLSSFNTSAPVVIHFQSGNYYFRNVETSNTGGLPPFSTAAVIANFKCGIALIGPYPGTTAAGGPLGVVPNTNASFYPQLRLAPPIATLWFSSFTSDGLTFVNNTNLRLSNFAINYEDGLTGRPIVPYTYATVTSIDENASNQISTSFDIQLVPGYPNITVPNSSELTPMFKAATQPLIMVTSTDSASNQYYNINTITLPAYNASNSCGSAAISSWAVNYSCPAGTCYHIYPNVCPAWSSVEQISSAPRSLSPSGLAVGCKVLILARGHGGLNFVSNQGNSVIRNIGVYTSPGNALAFFKNEGNVSISYLNLIPTDSIINGVANPLTVNGDGVLSLSGHATFDIFYSSFRALADDAIDINNRMSLFYHLGSDGNPYDRVVASVNGQNQLQLYDDSYSFDYAPGDQIAIVDRGSRDSTGAGIWGGILWAGTIQSATLVPPTTTVRPHWIITPTPSSPPLIGQELLSINLALTNSGNGSTVATVRRSTFYPSRGSILLKVPVSNFRYNYGTGAITPIAQGGVDFTNWAEGTVSPLSASGTNVLNIIGNVFNAAPGALVDNFSAPLIEVGAIQSDGGGFLNTPADNPLITVNMKRNWLNNARMVPFVIANSKVVNKANNITP